MATRKTPWIVLGPQPNGVSCTRCGEQQTLDLPARLEFATRWMRAFIATHQTCQEEAS